jgi:glycosyltransferase involved in cell wall biosynthesis
MALSAWPRGGLAVYWGMDWRIQCAAVVPCLNEAAHIGSVVAGVRRWLDHVLVIDDASMDGTAAAAAAAGAQVLKHTSNHGKGAALLDGWHWAQERNFEWALMLDGDGQHSTEDIPIFFRAAEETGAVLITGNRMHDLDRMPPVRRFVNRWMSRRLSEAAGRPLPDTQCGFRLMNLRALGSVRIQTARFEIESEVLLAFAAAGLKIVSVPVHVIYHDERSKIRPVQDTVRWFKWWLKAREARPKNAVAKARC